MQRFLKSLFRIGLLSLVILSLFCVRASAVGYDDYAVLVEENTGGIGFAGLGYTLSDDKRTLTLNFQVTDNHSYAGKNEINIAVNYGDKNGKIKLSADEIIIDESFPCEVKASSFKTKCFSDHTNVYAELELYFSKSVSEKLRIQVVITDSDGDSTEETSYEFPFKADCPDTDLSDKSKPEKTGKTERSTKSETSEKQSKKESAVKESSGRREYLGDHTVSEKTAISDEPYSSEGSLPDKADFSTEDNGAVTDSKRTVTAIITAAVLLSAGAVCAVAALRKGKGKD